MTARILALFAILGLTACETIDGFGQDVENGGQAISGAASDVQSDL